MSSANRGWLFYKKSYFHLDEKTDKLNDKKLKIVNDELLETKFIKNDIYQKSNYGFELETIYPGLIIGAGYSHNAKESKENFQLGLFFDHTTGYPIIAGSSVKGVLRSFFKRLKNKDEKELVLEFFQEILQEIGFEEEIDKKFLETLENEIFEGVDNEGKYITTYERDIFCDAFISNRSNDNKNILGEDYITPHDNPLLEPNPNRFLKILPEVSFRFNFELHDSKMTNLKAEHKESLFLNLLVFHGVGAKTNLNYGQFKIPPHMYRTA